MVHTLYVGTDTIVFLDSLQDDLTMTPVVDADITVTVTTESGIEVTNAVGLAAAHVEGGNYRVSVPAEAALTDRTRYVLDIEGTANGRPIRALERAVARYR